MHSIILKINDQYKSPIITHFPKVGEMSASGIGGFSTPVPNMQDYDPFCAFQFVSFVCSFCTLLFLDLPILRFARKRLNMRQIWPRRR